MGSILGQYALEWIWMGPYCKRMMERMCLEPPGRIWEVSGGSRKMESPTNKKNEQITKHQEVAARASQASFCGRMGGDRSVS